MDLMIETQKKLPPEDIIKVFNDNPGRQRVPAMWEQFGDITIKLFEKGALSLATLWYSAWTLGGQPAFAAKKMDQSELSDLYNDKEFLPAYHLTDELFANDLEMEVPVK